MRAGRTEPGVCQALTVLNLADPDEERFFKRHRAENAAPAQAVLDEADWLTLAHEDMDGLLTKVFAMIQPTIVKARTQPLESLGYELVTDSTSPNIRIQRHKRSSTRQVCSGLRLHLYSRIRTSRRLRVCSCVDSFDRSWTIGV